MAKSDAVIGIDIGGTTTSFGLVDRAGTCLVRHRVPTKAREPAQRLVARLKDSITASVSPFGSSHTLKGIGIGAPNANYYTGTVEDPPNLDWEGSVNLSDLFREQFGLPVALTNDANAAAIGEMEFGLARGMRHFIVITLGTGVGSGIVVNGEVLYGSDGFAGEIGHTVVDPDGRWCGCGKRGCLEAYASAGGLCKTVFVLLAERRDDSRLRDASFRELTARSVFEAATEGDGIAKAAFEETGRILGVKLADAVAHTSPEAIFLFGGLTEAGDLILEPTRRSLEAHLLKQYRGKVKLLISGLGPDSAAVLGGAALIWHELEKKRKPRPR